MSRPLVGLSIFLSVLLYVTIFPGLSYAQSGFIGSPFSPKPELNLVSTDWDGATVKLTCPGVPWDLQSTERGPFLRMDLSPLGTQAAEPGTPQVPTVRFWFEVPVCDEVTFTTDSHLGAYFSLEGTGATKVVPAQVSICKTPHIQPFELDDDAYSRSWNESPVRIVEEAWDGCHRMLLIELSPLTYDAPLGKISLRDEITVTFHFNGSDMAATHKNYSQHPPNTEDLALAYPAINSRWFAEVLWVDPLPVGYLIIAKSGWSSTMTNFVDWRRRMGYVVTVATEAQISPWTTAGIKSYIQTQYNAGNVDYVLLVGEATSSFTNYCPTYPGTQTYGGYIPPCTDLYYGCVSGTDHIQDIGVGRLSVTSANELAAVLGKILTYEQRTFSGTSWLKHNDFIGSSDPTYYIVSENTHRYCAANFFGPAGWTQDSIFPYSHSDNNASVTNAVNAGQVFNVYSGHGGESGYADYDISYPVATINALTNGTKYCIAVTHACLTGKFDFTSECGGEAWLRNGNGAAVLYWGSTCYTYWDEDDTLQRKWTRDFFQDSVRTMSGLARAGLRYVETKFGSTVGLYYWEEYNILGDPSLIPIWLTLDTLHATYPATVPVGTSNVTVTMRDRLNAVVQNALVCCYKAGEVQSSGYTNASGQYTMAVNPSTAGTMNFTATKANFVPVQGSLTVTLATPTLDYSTHTLSDAGGDGNGYVYPGEPIVMSITLNNSGTATATAVSATITSASTHIVIDDNAANYPNIAIAGNGTSLTNFYTWHALPTMAWPETLTFTVNWTSAEASGTTSFTVPIGFMPFPYQTDCDTAYGWTHNAVSGTDYWHKETHRYASAETSFAYNSGSPSYNYNSGARTSGVLVSPPIDLNSVSEALLSYKFWMQTQNGGLRRPDPGIPPPDDPLEVMDVLYSNDFTAGLDATIWHPSGSVDWALNTTRYNSSPQSCRVFDQTVPYSVNAWMQINNGTAFNVSGYAGLSLTLRYTDRTDSPNPRIVVYASRSAGGSGAAWDSVGGLQASHSAFISNGTAWYTFTVDLSAYDRAPQLSIAVRAIESTSMSFYMDDIQLTGTVYVPPVVDLGYVEITTDWGANWNILEQWDTTLTTWTTRSGISLNAYTGNWVKLRFRFDSVDALQNAFEGWYVDDINIVSANNYDLVGNPAPSGWAGGVVPRNAGGATITNCPVTATLPGNAASTFLNWAGQLSATSSSLAPSSFRNAVMLDGTWLAGWTINNTLLPGDVFGAVNTPSYTIRGGRHTLSLTVDSSNVVTETNETNNAWSGQYVWSPLSVTAVPSLRAAAPVRGSGTDPNCDGLKFKRETAARSWALAMLPTTGSADYTLNLHNDYTGSTTGFSTVLLSSSETAGLLDLVVVNAGATPDSFFAGIVCPDASPQTSDFLVQERTAVPLTLGSVNGPYTIGTDSLVDLYQVTLPAGSPMGVYLEYISGTADLGLSVYADNLGGTIYRSFAQVMTGGSANANLRGDENVTVNAPATQGNGIYTIAVWKPASSDRSARATYRLHIAPTGMVRITVNVSGLETVHPATLSYNLASGPGTANLSGTWSGLVRIGSTLGVDSLIAAGTGTRRRATVPISYIAPSSPATWTIPYETDHYLTVATTQSTPSGEGWYLEGNTADFAVPDQYTTPSGGSRWRFNAWVGTGTGSYSGTNLSASVTMDNPITETAGWTRQYQLTVVSAHGTPSGANWYDTGANATFAVTPTTVTVGADTRYIFTGWTSADPGGYTGASASHTMALTSAVTETAVWRTEYRLLLVSPFGAPTGGGWYTSGGTADMAMDISSTPPDAGTRHSFTGWHSTSTGGYTGSALGTSLTMSNAIYDTALWNTEYEVTVTTPHGTPTGAGWIVDGGNTQVGTTLLTTPDVGGTRQAFAGWTGTGSGSYTGTTAEPTLTVTGPVTQTALWYDQHLVTLATAYSTPVGGGWVWDDSLASWTCAETLIDVDADTRTMLTGWDGTGTGAYTGNDPTPDWTVTGPITETARWQDAYRLQVLSPQADPIGGGFYLSGATASFSVDTTIIWDAAGHRWVFFGWAGTGTGSYTGASRERNITVDNPVTETALWRSQYLLTLYTEYGTATGGGWYDQGAAAVFSVDSQNVNIGSDTRAHFTGWSSLSPGGYTGLNPGSTVFLDNAITDSARWSREFKVTVTSPFGAVAGGGWFNEGATTVLGLTPTVTPDTSGTRHAFVHWTGTGTGAYSGSTVGPTLTVNAPLVETAIWYDQHLLTVVTAIGDPIGGGWTWDDSSATWACTETLAQIDDDTRQVLTGWDGTGTGSYTGNDRVPVWTITDPVTETARWDYAYRVQIVSAHGTPFGAGWYATGQSAAFGLDTGLVWDPPGHRLIFDGWTGTGTGGYTGLEMRHSMNVTAPSIETAGWHDQYLLTLYTPYGTASGAGWYDAGTNTPLAIDSQVVSLAVDRRAIFAGWVSHETPGYTGSNPSANVALIEPVTDSARWTLEYRVTVISPFGPASGAGWFASGATTQLGLDVVATPDSSGTRHAFVRWGGTGAGSYTGSTPNPELTVTEPIVETAQWYNQHLVTLVSSESTPVGGGWVWQDSTATWSCVDTLIQIDAGTRHILTGWDGTGTGAYTGNAVAPNWTVTGPITETARWTTTYRVQVISAYATPFGAGWYTDGAACNFGLDTGIVWDPPGRRLLFTDWVGQGTSSYTGINLTHGLTIHGPVVETARWNEQFLLTLVTPQGTATGGGWYNAGTVVPFTMDSTHIVVSSNTRRQFTGWTSGDPGGYTGPDSEMVVTMANPVTETALWRTDLLLTLTSPYGTPYGAGWHAQGTSVTFGVTPDSVDTAPGTRAVFTGWTGSAYTGSLSEATITLDAPATESAGWSIRYQVTIVGGHGTFWGQGWYAAGQSAYFGIATSPVVETGTRYTFTRWTGAGVGSYSGTRLDTTIIVNNPLTETANWTMEYQLLVASPFGGPFGEGWYEPGTIVNFGVGANATPDSNGVRHVFVSWSFTGGPGGYTGTEQVPTVTMGGPITETALWTNLYHLIVLSDYGTPLGNGWYRGADTAYIAVLPSSYDLGTGRRRQLTGWTGSGTGSYTGSDQGPRIVIAGPVTELATWAIQFQVTFAKSPVHTFGWIAVNGDTSRGVSTVTTWADSAQPLIAEVSPHDWDNTSVYSFNHWSSGATTSRWTFNLYAPGTWTAIYDSTGVFLDVTLSEDSLFAPLDTAMQIYIIPQAVTIGNSGNVPFRVGLTALPGNFFTIGVTSGNDQVSLRAIMNDLTTAPLLGGYHIPNDLVNTTIQYADANHYHGGLYILPGVMTSDPALLTENLWISLMGPLAWSVGTDHVGVRVTGMMLLP